MTRPPVVQPLLSFSASVALVKGVERALRGYVPEKWLGTVASKQLELRKEDEVINQIERVLAERDSGDDMNWEKVFRFVLQEVLKWQLPILVSIGLLCLLAPVVAGLCNRRVCDKQFAETSVQTEKLTQESVHRTPTPELHDTEVTVEPAPVFAVKEFVTLVPEVRAEQPVLPQQSESESESETESASSEQVADVIAPAKETDTSSLLTSEKSIGLKVVEPEPENPTPVSLQAEDIESESLAAVQPVELPQAESPLNIESVIEKEIFEQQELAQDSVHQGQRSSSESSGLGTSPKQSTASSKSPSPVAWNAGTTRDSPTSSDSKARIHLSPSRAPTVDAEVNTEQAYSQPFTY